MTKRKNDICPENVGNLFLRQGEDIPYRLISCDSEPRALLAKVTELNVPSVPGMPISLYEDFVLLKPVVSRVRVKPEKKPRKDKGGKHNRNKPYIPEIEGGGTGEGETKDA